MFDGTTSPKLYSVKRLKINNSKLRHKRYTLILNMSHQTGLLTLFATIELYKKVAGATRGISIAAKALDFEQHKGHCHHALPGRFL